MLSGVELGISTFQGYGDEHPIAYHLGTVQTLKIARTLPYGAHVNSLEMTNSSQERKIKLLCVYLP